MEKILKLTQLLNSKLCHELAGLIGAVNNCVELLEMPKEIAGEAAKKLLSNNSQKLVTAIKFYRMLYGFAHDGDEVSINELKNLIHDFVKDEKMPVFEGQIKKNISLNIAKIIMGLYLCARDNISKEGKIIIDINIVKNKFTIKLTASGSNVKVKENKTHFLLNFTDFVELEIYNIQECYIFYLCQQENLIINILHSKNSIEYIVKHKRIK